MIAIDTNVLLRYLLRDDDEQGRQAELLLKLNGKCLLTDVVLAETVWTLGSHKKYRVGKDEIIGVISALIEDAGFCFENSQVVWQALNDYRKATPVNGKQAGFADALIAAKAQYIARQKCAELAGTYTFDRAAQHLPGMLAVKRLC